MSIVLGEAAEESDCEPELETTTISQADIGKKPYTQMSALHKSLLAKNQQFYLCLAHLQRFPYEKATKDFNSISQRLVLIQKNMQDVNLAVTNLKRERKNLNTNINLIG